MSKTPVPEREHRLSGPTGQEVHNRQNEDANLFALRIAAARFGLAGNRLYQSRDVQNGRSMLARFKSWDLDHDTFGDHNGVGAMVRLIRRIDRSGGVGAFWQMAEEDADPPLGTLRLRNSRVSKS